MSNTTLHRAKKLKRDEFYTPLDIIEKRYAGVDLKGKVIYCNCDDPDKSAFVAYFSDNFEKHGLKKLIATGLGMEYGLIKTTAGVIRPQIKSDGSYDSPEFDPFYEEADAVITNPPFSLVRYFYAHIKEKGVDFDFLGNQSMLSYLCFFSRLHGGGYTCNTQRYGKV